MGLASLPVRRSTSRTRVLEVGADGVLERPDQLAGEEPMEIRAGGPSQEASAVAVTMRTPGRDFDLAVGFLLTEGLLGSREEIEHVAYCEDLDEDEQRYNIVTVRLRRGFDHEALHRNFFANSSCGICGKASIEDVEVRCSPLGPGPVVRGAVLARLPDELRRAQGLFDRTGGLHAAGIFDPTGELVDVAEDVGRHNAVDKVVGRAFLAGELPLARRILQVSGRVSFEIAQKAALAGIPIVAAVSAPSSLAVQTAERLGMTIVGFVRDGGFNVYTGAERVRA